MPPPAAGETSEALPAAEKASLFRGSGVIGGREVPGNRNAATVYGCEAPRRREGCFWAQRNASHFVKCQRRNRRGRGTASVPRMRPTFSFVLAKDKVNCPKGKRGGPWGQTCRARYKRKPPFARLLVRPEQMGLGSSSCAGPVELSLRSRRSCFVGCKPEGAKRTRGSFCAAAARPGIRRRLLTAGSYMFFFCPLSGSGAVAESSPICTNDSA